MKDKFKVIGIVLFLLLLSLYTWNLFLYDKYGGIGRYQIYPIFKGIIDTKNGNIFMPAPPPSALKDAERWYSVEPITLEEEGYVSRFIKGGKRLLEAGFTEKEIEDYLRRQQSHRAGMEKLKRPKTGLTIKEAMKRIMTESKKTELEK